MTKKEKIRTILPRILTLNISNRQAVANLVMALASCQTAKSVVALSKSPVFHHQYCSLTDAISNLAKNERELKRVRKLFQEHWLKYFPIRGVNHFQTDVVNISANTRRVCETASIGIKPIM